MLLFVFVFPFLRCLKRSRRRGGAHGFVDGAEDLVDLADLGLVLQIDGCVEVGHLLVGELRHGVPLTRVQERRHLCARKTEIQPQRSEKITPQQRTEYPRAGWEQGVAPTDDLRGRALVTEPAAAAATPTAAAAEPAATSAEPASTSAEASTTAAPSRWPHGSCGAFQLKESWARGMRRALAAREGREAAEETDGGRGQGLLGFLQGGCGALVS